MPEEKTQCRECGAAIQLWTAERTGGMCMPCATGSPRPPDPNDPFPISCVVGNDDNEVVYITTAQELLARLEVALHFGDESHPNRLELAAQRALVSFAIRHRGIFRFRDDHWSTTGGQLWQLFKEGRASLIKFGKTYEFSDLYYELVREDDDPCGRVIGDRYVDSDGVEILSYGIFTS